MPRLLCVVPIALSALLTCSSAPPVLASAPPAQRTKASMAVAIYKGAPVTDAVAATHKAELVAKVREMGGQSPWPSRVVDELMTFRLSEAGWQLMLSDKGVMVAFRAARDINDYTQRLGLGDLEKVESANNNDRESTQSEVEELLAKFKPVIALTFEATQPVISPTSASLILRAFATVPEHMDRGVWKPMGGIASIRTILSPDARDTTVTMNREKTSFTITTSSKTEMVGWSTKIEKGLDRGK